MHDPQPCKWINNFLLQYYAITYALTLWISLRDRCTESHNPMIYIEEMFPERMLWTPQRHVDNQDATDIQKFIFYLQFLKWFLQQMLSYRLGTVNNFHWGFRPVVNYNNKKLMKGKALRKHSLHEKTAASVLLKLFISSNEWCHTTDAPLAHDRNSIFKCKQHTCTVHDPWGPEKYDNTMM